MSRLFDLNPYDRGFLTDKQVSVVSLIIDGMRDEEGKRVPIDMNTLLERLPYKTTRDSMQFTIRALVRRRIIKKHYIYRREQKRACYEVTEYGITLIDRLFSQDEWEKKIGGSYLDVYD